MGSRRDIDSRDTASEGRDPFIRLMLLEDRLDITITLEMITFNGTKITCMLEEADDGSYLLSVMLGDSKIEFPIDKEGNLVTVTGHGKSQTTLTKLLVGDEKYAALKAMLASDEANPAGAAEMIFGDAVQKILWALPEVEDPETAHLFAEQTGQAVKKAASE